MDKFRKALVVAAMIFAVALCIYFMIPSDYGYYEKITNHTYDVISLFVVILAFMTFRLFRLSSIEGRVWFLLFLGLAVWFIADVGWTVQVYLGTLEFPSFSDAIYIIGYVIIIAAMFLEYRISREVIRLKNVMIGAAVALLTLVLSGFTALIPVSSSTESYLAKAITLFYPIADTLIIFTAAVLVLTLHHAKSARSWLLIGIGLVFWVIADIMQGFIEWSETGLTYIIADPIWILGLIFIGLGAYYHKLLFKGEI